MLYSGQGKKIKKKIFEALNALNTLNDHLLVPNLNFQNGKSSSTFKNSKTMIIYYQR